MDSCRCCRWIRFITLFAIAMSFSFAAKAYEFAYEAKPRVAKFGNFVSWFEPKLRAVLEESTGVVADRLPIKLAMAQAALESGWGKSKAAVSRKNFFGLMRSNGTPMSFASAEESIRYYVKTLSEHPAYSSFRKRLGNTDSPDELAKELRAYSEHPDYPVMLKTIMRSEKLSHLDTPDDEAPVRAHEAPTREGESERNVSCSWPAFCEPVELRLDHRISI